MRPPAPPSVASLLFFTDEIKDLCAFSCGKATSLRQRLGGRVSLHDLVETRNVKQRGNLQRMPSTTGRFRVFISPR